MKGALDIVMNWYLISCLSWFLRPSYHGWLLNAYIFENVTCIYGVCKSNSVRSLLNYGLYVRWEKAASEHQHIALTQSYCVIVMFSQNLATLIAGALCTRIVARFLQVFQTFWASSYKVTLSATFVTSAFIALCIRTFLHSMSILVAVITQTRVLSCAFFDSTLVWPASHISSVWRCHKHSDLAFLRADCFELNFFSFLKPSVSFRLDSALKHRTVN